MIAFQNISKAEKEELLKFPAYISLLAANGEESLEDLEEKKLSMELSFSNTFSYDPLLAEYYKEADKVLAKNLLELDKSLPLYQKERQKAIEQALIKIQKLVLKLDDGYALIFHRSMKSFKEHVSRAHHNILFHFIFPIPLSMLGGVMY